MEIYFVWYNFLTSTEGIYFYGITSYFYYGIYYIGEKSVALPKLFSSFALDSNNFFLISDYIEINIF